ncbi:MAG TPA: hypothetical protein VMZ28_10095 [Kofleriaceae bacterium]|nr:hypothetical protein [Kofleriaceae bacterium]
MHQAKIGIVAAALAGAIVIVLGVFQRDDDDGGRVTDEGVKAATAPVRASAERPVGQGWAAFGAPATGVHAPATGVDALGMTRGASEPRRAATRRHDPGRMRDAAMITAAEARLRDLGDDSWRLGGTKGEGAVKATGYREASAGKRTELTSGRHIGQLHVRVPDSTELDVALAGRDGAPVRAEVCVGKSGKPTEVRVVDGTGVAKVDERVAKQLLAGRYRPLVRDGRRVEFCERATVIVTGT